VLLLLSPSFLNAGDLQFAWDKNPPVQNVAGYRLYFGYSSSSYYSHIDVGNVNTVLITDLDLSRINFFALTAYRPCLVDDECQACLDGGAVCESGFSAEVSYQPPLPLPQKASGAVMNFEWVDAPAQQYFEDFEGYATGDDPAGWTDTKAGNSLDIDDLLFKIAEDSGNKVLAVKNTGINVHSHYEQIFTLPFNFTGKMKRNSGGMGITFLSDYPNSDKYYRLRSQGSDAFHIAPHPNSAVEMIGQTTSGVIPITGQRYNFKIEVLEAGKIKAKVWPENQNEPAAWQIDCTVSNPVLTQGKIGAWSMLSNNNFWDDLKVK